MLSDVGDAFGEIEVVGLNVLLPCIAFASEQRWKLDTFQDNIAKVSHA